MLIMRFCSLFSFVFSFAVSAHAQDPEISISGKVLDERTRQPVPYAHIRNAANRQGTISNTEGFFQLNAHALGDTLVVSFTGYDKQYIAVRDFRPGQEILLLPQSQLLESVNVTRAGTSYLYDLLTACGRKIPDVTKTAKTYYELESFVDNQQAELISMYYNGDFSGYEIKALHLKNARIDLAAHDQRLFISAESSNALRMFQLFGRNEWFPENPFGIRKSALPSKYKLSLDQKYRNENGHAIYVIDFMPRAENGKYFQGKVWIDSLESCILRIVLKAPDAAIHPFVALHLDSLQRVDLEITQTFDRQGGLTFLNHLDFKYDVWYKILNQAGKKQRISHADSVYRVSTRAVLYAYDYENAFLLPQFRFFESGMYHDYRNGCFYNPYFWTEIDEFKLRERGEGKLLFIRDSADISNRDAFAGGNSGRQGLLEHPYVIWGQKRIRFRTQEAPPETGTPADLYHFEVQLYMDLNPAPEGVNMLTRVVLDPFESHFRFPPTDTAALCFLNLYFDLMEIHRRELEVEVRRGPMEIVRIRELYQQRLRQMQTTGKTFLKETERGGNKKALEKWNRYVYERLGIDNLAYFGLYQ